MESMVAWAMMVFLTTISTSRIFDGRLETFGFCIRAGVSTSNDGMTLTLAVRMGNFLLQYTIVANFSS